MGVNPEFQKIKDEQAQVDKIIADLFANGLATQNPDGTITLKGTDEQLKRAGLDTSRLGGALNRQFTQTQSDIAKLQVQRRRKAQEIAYLEQQLGRIPELDDDVLYFMHNPAPVPGRERPLAMIGSELKKHITDLDGSGNEWWRLLSMEEVDQHMLPDGSADVDVVVGFEADMTVEMLQPEDWNTPPRFGQF